jgi:enoyl-CoA hydratase/carnithine racemase
MNYETIKYEVKDHTVTINLNRPEKGNALSPTMRKELFQAWQYFKQDDNLYVAILTGAGENFCKGDESDDPMEHLDKTGFPAGQEIWKPIIVAVNGECMGPALVFIGQGDIIIASENATFGYPDLASGIVPAYEVAWNKDRLALSIIAQLALVGNIDAARAYELGWVTEVTAPDKLISRAMEIAGVICQQSQATVRCAKEVLSKSRDLFRRDAVRLGENIAARMRDSEDAKEGILARVENRKPVWKS